MDPFLIHYTGRIAIKRAPGHLPGTIESRLRNLAGLRDMRRLAAGEATGGVVETDLDRWEVVEAESWRPDTVLRSVRAPGLAMLDIEDRLRRIRPSPGIEIAEPEVVFQAVGEPKDGFAADPPLPALPADWDWHHQATHVSQAWNLARGEGVIIGHLDTGIDRGVAGELLGGRLVEGPDFDDGRDIQEHFDFPRFPPWHGIGTLCLLAADGADGYRGVAPSARVRSSRISPSVVLIRNTALAAGMRDAVDHGAQVISVSMGGAASPLWADAVDYAYRRGVLICAAAGNNFGWTPHCVGYPARFQQPVAVAGITRDEHVPYSDYPGKMRGNFGPQVDICAPTPDVLWARPDGSGGVAFGPGAGTSTATPQVAGAAALWLGKWQAELSAAAFSGANAWKRAECCRRALLGSARLLPGQAGFDPKRGFGCLDALAALGERWRPIEDIHPTRRDFVERPWWKTLNPCDDD